MTARSARAHAATATRSPAGCWAPCIGTGWAFVGTEKIEGTVDVQILIGASGKVTNACIVQSVSYLDHAALEAVYQWRFSPAIKNGAPVATIARAPVMFRIH